MKPAILEALKLAGDWLMNNKGLSVATLTVIGLVVLLIAHLVAPQYTADVADWVRGFTTSQPTTTSP